MADPHVITGLEDRGDRAHELRAAIVTYEEHIDRTRHELAVVTAMMDLEPHTLVVQHLGSTGFGAPSMGRLRVTSSTCF